MERKEMLDILDIVLSDYMGEKLNHPDVLANVVLEEVEKYMLPPSTDIYCSCSHADGTANRWSDDET